MLASGKAMAYATFDVFLFSALPHESPALIRSPRNDQAPPQQLMQTHQHTNTKRPAGELIAPLPVFDSSADDKVASR